MGQVRIVCAGLVAVLLLAGAANVAFADEGGAAALQMKPDVPSPAFALETPNGATNGAPRPASAQQWYQLFNISGVVRFRNRIDYAEGGRRNHIAALRIAQHRVGIAVLLNLGGKGCDDCFTWGVQVGTGLGATGIDQIFGFDAAGGGATTVFGAPAIIGIRQAWAAFTLVEMLRITVGMMPFPDTMFRSILTFDADLSLTGLHLVVKAIEQKDDKKKVTTGIYANVLALYVGDSGTAGKEDQYVFAVNAHVLVSLITAGVSFWHMTHTKAGDDTDTNTQFSDRLFAAMELYVMATLADMLDVFIHTVLNANGGRDNTVAARGKGFGILGGVRWWTGERRTSGYLLLELMYYYMQRNAWPDRWTDQDSGRGFTTSQAGGMPGSSGVRLMAEYWLAACVILRLQLYTSYFIDNTAGFPNEDHDLFFTLLFDVEVTF